jgi:hypothetical protein
MAAIVAADLSFKFSTTAGAAGNSTAGTAAGSLGKYCSTTAWADGATLFDDISGAENAASTVDYRCVFLHNTNAANAYQNAVVYIASQVSGGADIAIGVDPTASLAVGSSTAQAVTIANETTAPAGVTFSTPATVGAGLALGSIASGFVRGIWIRRTATNSAALSADGFTLATSGDTGSL